MSRLNREALARRARDLAIQQGISIKEAYRELGRRAGKASAAKRREKQLSNQPTLPVFLTKEASTSNPHLTGVDRRALEGEVPARWCGG
jgi:hypothetical protein